MPPMAEKSGRSRNNLSWRTSSYVDQNDDTETFFVSAKFWDTLTLGAYNKPGETVLRIFLFFEIGFFHFWSNGDLGKFGFPAACSTDRYVKF